MKQILTLSKGQKESTPKHEPAHLLRNLQPHLNFGRLSLVRITHRFQIQPRRAIYVVVLRVCEAHSMYEAQIGN
jgi:hypothetical protein